MPTWYINSYPTLYGLFISGYEDLGGGVFDESKTAKEALVLMAVGMKSKWKMPISYHLTKGCNAETQKTLIMHAIEALEEQRIHVRVVTCDGCATNLATARQLGCNTEENDFSFTFEGRKIYVALDACHMIKVLRNLFADLFVLNTPDGKVQWQHIKDLVAVQEKGQLHLGNKLTKHHINYKTQIMKVKLAVQVISQSTADALTTLRESGYYTEFKNSTPTTLFLKVSFRRKTCNIHCAALCISET